MNALDSLIEFEGRLNMVFAFDRREHVHIADERLILGVGYHIDNFLFEIISKFVYLSRADYLPVNSSRRSMYASNTAKASSIGRALVISTPAILNTSIGGLDEPALRKLM